MGISCASNSSPICPKRQPSRRHTCSCTSRGADLQHMQHPPSHSRSSWVRPGCSTDANVRRATSQLLVQLDAHQNDIGFWSKAFVEKRHVLPAVLSSQHSARKRLFTSRSRLTYSSTMRFSFKKPAGSFPRKRNALETHFTYLPSLFTRGLAENIHNSSLSVNCIAQHIGSNSFIDALNVDSKELPKFLFKLYVGARITLPRLAL